MAFVEPTRTNILRAVQCIVDKGEDAVLDGQLDRFLKNLAWVNAHDMWDAENKGFDGLCEMFISDLDSSITAMADILVPILLTWGIMPEIYETRLVSIRDTYVHEFKHELNILMRGE